MRSAIGPIPGHWVRALWLAAAWIGLQLLIGLTGGAGFGNIAIWAHVGGFVAGLLLARPVLRWRFKGK
ncbi:rhomboid family intramembrane serine protease [Sphingopyxis sp. PET50]|uniref:rhomboid family intramembrane serine protease n=1 Tax=Sphingopyxis sp. PET50 TaxID=2976533 RepID=UPI0021AF868A|nr:rhomboid family intramembrane serine protease [Sphingopyxis sp. PET50]